MNKPHFPPKPFVAMPRVQDAKKAHKCRPKKQVEQLLYNKKLNTNKDIKLPTIAPHQSRPQQKRKAFEHEDGNPAQNASERLKANPSPSHTSAFQTSLVPDRSGSLQTALKISIPLTSTAIGRQVPYADPLSFVPPPFLRWDKATRRFVVLDTISIPLNPAPATATVYSDCASTLKRKRLGIGPPSQDETERRLKRLKITVNNKESVVSVNAAANATISKRGKARKHARGRKKAPTQTSLNVRLEDLFPHYIPDSENFAQARTKETETLKAVPKRFMDLPTEIRQNIWDKVFEDEAYKFTIKKESKSGQVSDMISTPPPSFKCLFIHPLLAGEVAEQMYKSMRVEITFGRLRPGATRLFMKKMANTRLGREAHRIFFNKSLSLHKVNVGVFPKAREIVSTNWTVYGDQKMNADDYLNNHIDPEHVLRAPPTAPAKQKGLKERRFWKDQHAASQRYKRHMEGWCHPEAEDPNQTVRASDPNHPSSMIDVPVKVHKRPCPFNDKCLNLKDTKFCIVVKYKFSCIKGRHSRHKEALFDFYPGTGRIEQTRAPKSRFYNKSGN